MKGVFTCLKRSYSPLLPVYLLNYLPFIHLLTNSLSPGRLLITFSEALSFTSSVSTLLTECIGESYINVGKTRTFPKDTKLAFSPFLLHGP